MVCKTELEKGGGLGRCAQAAGSSELGKTLLVNEALVTSTFWPRTWGQAHMCSTHIKNEAEQSVGKRMRTASQQAAQGQGASAPF